MLAYGVCAAAFIDPWWIYSLFFLLVLFSFITDVKINTHILYHNKDDVFADENMSCCWIPQSPCLSTCCIANNDTFGGVWLEVALFGLGNMHICYGTKGSEVTDRRFAAMPRFKRSLMREGRGGRGVVDFNKCHSGFTPECEREVL